MEYIIAIICLALGAVIGYLLDHGKSAGLQARLDMLQSDNLRLTGEKEEMQTENELRQQELRQQYERQMEAQREQQGKQLAELRTQHREDMEKQIQLLREQMMTTSEKILKERSEELSVTNQQQLSAILNPLRSEINLMKETVDKSGREHATSMERLDASIKANMEQANALSERADRLANALTGENNKSQGNFGELRLRQLLEDMGLEEGVQFEEQTTMKDANGRVVYDEEDGSRMIPDVILHFPDKRDIIIDSKMSLKAFVDYQNAETDEERRQCLDRHIASVRSHVVELSRKNYTKYQKGDAAHLDFVVMYIFQESALQLALANAPTLWKEAYDQGVVISGSQNLYMMLRVLEMTWKQVRQVENQQKIIEAANSVIDRVQLFYERFLKVDEMLDKTRSSFNDLKRVTTNSGQSISTAAAKLLKYGGRENPKRKARLEEAVKSSEEEEESSPLLT